MHIDVKLYFHLRRYSPTGESAFGMDLPPGSTAARALSDLGLSEGPPKVILVNGRPAAPNTTLQPGDSLVVFPPLEGG